MSVVPRCNESLKAKTEGSIRLTYTGLCGELEHLKIETRLTWKKVCTTRSGKRSRDGFFFWYLFVYHESIKRVKTTPTYECRCDERLQPEVEELESHTSYTLG
jgi:hypothetical protein